MATLPPLGKKDTATCLRYITIQTTTTLKWKPDANKHQERSHCRRAKPLATSYLTRLPIQIRAKKTIGEVKIAAQMGNGFFPQKVPLLYRLEFCKPLHAISTED